MIEMLDGGDGGKVTGKKKVTSRFKRLFMIACEHTYMFSFYHLTNTNH